jgi:hypothetical protein
LRLDKLLRHFEVLTGIRHQPLQETTLPHSYLGFFSVDLKSLRETLAYSAARTVGLLIMKRKPNFLLWERNTAWHT